MTFLAFLKAMLSEDLTEIGFKYSKEKNDYGGPIWYKIVDDSVYLCLTARKLSYGDLKIYVGIHSLFSPLMSNFMFYEDLVDPYTQMVLSKGGNIGPVGIWLQRPDKDEAPDRYIALGKKCLALVKPVLSSVHDLESCFNAKQQLGYLGRYYYGKKWVGREYTPDDYTEHPPEDPFFILFLLGRFEEAERYLHHNISDFAYIQRDASDLDRLIGMLKDELDPYIELIQQKKYDQIKEKMLEFYNKNCDWIENNHRVVIDRSRGLSLLDSVHE